MHVLIAILASSVASSMMIAIHRYHVVKRIMHRADTAGRAALITTLASADILTRWAVAAWLRRVDKGETARLMTYQRDRAQRDTDALNLLIDLDRCEHGRHQGDSCCDCPNWYSTGNPLFPVGSRIGTTLSGDPIYMPRRGQRHLPREWMIAPDTQDVDR